MIWLPLGLAYAGMATLCLAMNRHHRQVTGRLPGRRMRLVLQASGWLILTLSLLICMNVWGVTIGPVVWFGTLTAGTLLLVLLLPYAARAAMLCGAASCLLTLSGSVLVLAG